MPKNIQNPKKPLRVYEVYIYGISRKRDHFPYGRFSLDETVVSNWNVSSDENCCVCHAIHNVFLIWDDAFLICSHVIKSRPGKRRQFSLYHPQRHYSVIPINMPTCLCFLAAGFLLIFWENTVKSWSRKAARLTNCEMQFVRAFCSVVQQFSIAMSLFVRFLYTFFVTVFVPNPASQRRRPVIGQRARQTQERKKQIKVVRHWAEGECIHTPDWASGLGDWLVGREKCRYVLQNPTCVKSEFRTHSIAQGTRVFLY